MVFNKHKSIKGTRKDLGVYVRSKMEANYLRYLNLLQVKWEYEPRTFYFEGIKRGTVCYTPDIYLPESDQWVELKGWLNQRSRVAIKRFKKFYPGEFIKLGMVMSNTTAKSSQETVKWLSELGIKSIDDYGRLERRVKKLIKNWE